MKLSTIKVFASDSLLSNIIRSLIQQNKTPDIFCHNRNSFSDHLRYFGKKRYFQLLPLMIVKIYFEKFFHPWYHVQMPIEKYNNRINWQKLKGKNVQTCKS